MNLSENAALLLMAAEHTHIDRATIVNWADEMIAYCDPPECWLIELSTLQSSRLEDFISVLRGACDDDLCDTEHRMMTVIDAYTTGILDLNDVNLALWKIWSGPDNLYQTERFPDQIADSLASWDCLDDLSAIPPSLAQRFEQLFQEFRTAHPNVISYYRHPLSNNGQQDGGGNSANAPCLTLDVR